MPTCTLRDEYLRLIHACESETVVFIFVVFSVASV